ncbi:MAG: hypothetical protein GY856_02895 [bacterium]|nr:hypothetical protein [bacterium]
MDGRCPVREESDDRDWHYHDESLGVLGNDPYPIRVLRVESAAEHAGSAAEHTGSAAEHTGSAAEHTGSPAPPSPGRDEQTPLIG